MEMNAMFWTDFYKVGHINQYPKGIKKVYSNLTARTSRLNGVNEVVVFGYTHLIKDFIMDYFQKNFFDKPKEEVVNSYKSEITMALNTEDFDTTHIERLHDLGYLPIVIKALPEGTLAPIRVPFITIENTIDEFFWVTNYIETIFSAIIWQPITSATIAFEYRKIVDKYFAETGSDEMEWFKDFQCHDFSFRGMGGRESACTSGMGHLTSFMGTDTLPAIICAKQYYNEDGFVGGSVGATEHSVMTSSAKIYAEKINEIIEECSNKEDAYEKIMELVENPNLIL
ncbi:nicotinamide phosphoribosyltransferase domain-containing protein [uncultured Arcobacter sp.]|uniref:nicotinamide phosphoribosyltransferase domain-containing protein n=1 Tax=uncultured Arcobacter sp. TaxID=165434 RepID=UPI00261DF04A|nr:nicotinamide phosphoribosyltransferase domain-containing protein [uncultured Arcobacter sp.]